MNNRITSLNYRRNFGFVYVIGMAKIVWLLYDIGMKFKGIFAGLAAASIWGGMYVVSKVVLEVIPPFTLLVIRLLLGAITLGLVLVWQKWPGFTRQETLRVVGVGVIGLGISLGFQFVGTRLSTAINGALITSATPAFVFLFASPLLGEKISRRQIGALAVATLGVLAVIDPRAAQLSPRLFWGNLSLAAAGLTWALYSVLVRKATRSLATLPVSFVAFVGGMLVAFPAGVWEQQSQVVGEITGGIVLGLLYLGVISTAVALFLWNKAFELLEAGVASLTFFAQPLFGTILGVLFLDEQLTPLFMVGGLLIGLGLWFAATETKPTTKNP